MQRNLLRCEPEVRRLLFRTVVTGGAFDWSWHMNTGQYRWLHMLFPLETWSDWRFSSFHLFFLCSVLLYLIDDHDIVFYPGRSFVFATCFRMNDDSLDRFCWTMTLSFTQGVLCWVYPGRPSERDHVHGGGVLQCLLVGGSYVSQGTIFDTSNLNKENSNPRRYRFFSVWISRINSVVAILSRGILYLANLITVEMIPLTTKYRVWWSCFS